MEKLTSARTISEKLNECSSVSCCLSTMYKYNIHQILSRAPFFLNVGDISSELKAQAGFEGWLSIEVHRNLVGLVRKVVATSQA